MVIYQSKTQLPNVYNNKSRIQIQNPGFVKVHSCDIFKIIETKFSQTCNVGCINMFLQHDCVPLNTYIYSTPILEFWIKLSSLFHGFFHILVILPFAKLIFSKRVIPKSWCFTHHKLKTKVVQLFSTFLLHLGHFKICQINYFKSFWNM